MKINRLQCLLILMFIMISMTLFGQTVLISPTGDGGFESGATFEANGWTVSNSANNPWVVGTGVANASFTNRSAYISNDAGVSNNYSHATCVNYLYKDITIPAGETKVRLSFNWVSNGESTWDLMQVFYSSTSITPTGSTTYPGSGLASIPSGISGATFIGSCNLQTSVQSALFTLPTSVAGTTIRLIFAWKNDGSGGLNPAGSIDNILLTSELPPPPLTGLKTIGPAGNYTTFTAAINALNDAGVGAGGVTFNVAAGFVSAENPPAITATGTTDNPIIFQKSGAGNNPKITPTGTLSASPYDFGFCISGGDYITFDGIDVDASGATTTVNATEYGYLIRNASATNGAQYNTIKNCSVTLNKNYIPTAYSACIYSSVSSTQGGVAPSNVSGANSYNKFYNLTLQNAQNGVYLEGNSSYPDLNCEIGVSGTIPQVTRNTISNMGGVYSGASYGIYAKYQNGTKIFNNDVNNVSTTGSNQATGISLSYFTGATVNEIFNNKVDNIFRLSSSTSVKSVGIETYNTSGTPTVRVYNNFVSNIRSVSTSTANVPVYGIYSYHSSAAIAEIDNNNVYMIDSNNPLYSSTCFGNGSSSGVYKLRGNIFVNAFPTQTTSSSGPKHFCIYTVSTSTLGAAGSLSDYNDLYIVNDAGVSGFIGRAGSSNPGTPYATLANWQTFNSSAYDANSKNVDPEYYSATDLHVASSDLNAVINFIPQEWVTFDIDAQTRSAYSPHDIGADAYNPTLMATAVSDTQIQVEFASAGQNKVIVWNQTGVFTDPSGVPPAVGQALAGGTLLYYGQSSPQNHTGLTPKTVYYYKSYTYNGGVYSAPKTASTITYGTPNPPVLTTPTDYASNLVKLTSLNWTSGGGNPVPTGYRVYLGTNVDANNILNGVDAGLVLTYAPNLNYNTTYYWKVVAYNAYGNSDPSTTRSFTTMLDPTKPLPYFEDFNASTSLPANWSGTMSVTSNHGVNNSNGLTRNMWSSTTTANMTTCPIGPLTGASELKFNYRFVEYDGYPSTGTTLGANDKIEIQISTNDGETYTTVHTIDNSNHTTSVDFAEKTVNLSAYTGQTVFVKFLLTWGAGDYYVDIDNFKARLVPSGPAVMYTPTALDFGIGRVNGTINGAMYKMTITNVGTGTMNLSTSNFSLVGAHANQFVVYPDNLPASLIEDQSVNVMVGFTPTSAGVKNATLRLTFNAQSYDVSLTGEAISEYNLFEDFNATWTGSPLIPNLGWQNPGGWARGTAAPLFETTGAQAYIGSTTADPKLLVTPKVTINSTSNIRFYAKTTSPNSSQRIKIQYSSNGTDWSDIGMPIALPQSAPWTQYTVDLGSIPSGNYYLAFSGYNTGTAGNVNIDYVVGPYIFQAPVLPATNPNPAHLAISISRTPTLSWSPDISNDAGIPSRYKVYLGTTPIPVNLIGTVTTPTLTVTNNLLYNTTYYWKVVPVNSLGDAANCPTWSFTTVEDPTIRTYPFTEGFEENNTHASTNIKNWTQALQTGSNYWTINSTETTYNRTPRTGSFNATLKYSGNTWLFRPVQLTAGVSYTVSIYARQDGATASNANVGFYYGSTASIAGMTNTIVSQTNLINGDYQKVTGTFTPASSGDFYLGIRGYISSSPWYLSIDDFNIKLTPTTPIFACTPSSHNFGNVTFNETSAPKTFTIMNDGIGTLSLLSATIVGTHASMFTLTNNNTPPINLTAGQTATVSVVFNATSLGAKVAILRFTDNQGNSYSVNLSATSIDPTIRTFPHNENFDLAQFPSAGWANTQLTGTGTDKIWARVTSGTSPNCSPQSGAGMAFYNSTLSAWNGASANLTTPNIVFPNANYQVKFWMYHDPGWTTYPDSVYVVYNNTIVTGFPRIDAVAGWQRHRVVLPIAEGGETAKVSFKAVARYGNNMFIDNITFETAPSYKPARNLVVQVVGGAANILWDPPVLTANDPVPAGYKIIRNEQTFQSIAYGTNSFIDRTIINGNTYTYKVVAFYTESGSGFEDYANPTNSVTVTYDVLLAPTNLTSLTNARNVTLNWAAPQIGTNWIAHGDPNTFSINFSPSQLFTVAQRFTTSYLSTNNYVGSTLKKIKFMPGVSSNVYNVKVWLGGSASGSTYNPGTLIIDQAVTGTVTAGTWNEVTLTTPISIPSNQELWIGYSVSSATGTPAACDAGPAVNGQGNLLFFNNQWRTLTSYLSFNDYNFLIQGYLESPYTTSIISNNEIMKDDANSSKSSIKDKESFSLSKEERTQVEEAIERTRLGYNIYRDNVLINQTPVEELTYTENDVPDGQFTYGVRAVYDAGLSNPVTTSVTINVADAYPPSNLAYTAGYGVVTLTWNAPATRRVFDGYKVYRNGVAITGVITDTLYADTTVEDEITYAYTVKAVYSNPAGESAPTNTVNAMALIPIYNPPRNLTAEANYGVIHLAWEEPLPVQRQATQKLQLSRELDFVGYVVYRNSVAITDYIQELTYSDTNVENGVNYTYYIKAYYLNPNGFSPASNSVVSTPVIPVYNPPLNLTAVADYGLIDLTWEAPVAERNTNTFGKSSLGTIIPPTFVGYVLYRNDIAITETVTTLTYRDTDVTDGIDYTYYVKAVYEDPDGMSVASNAVISTPTIPVYNPPQNLTAIAGDTKVTLAWEAPLANREVSSDSRVIPPTFVGYVIYRNGVSITEPITELTYLDTDVVNYTNYSYYIKAVYADPDGESVASNTVQAMPEEALIPVENLVADLDYYDVTLTWEAPVNPDRAFLGYKVYRNSTLLNTELLSVLTYNDLAVDPGNYTYAVTAMYDGGESIQRTVAVQVDNIQPVRNLTAIVNIYDVSLAWEAPATEQRSLLGYSVHRDGVLLNETPITELTYIDEDVTFGPHIYMIIAKYSAGESEGVTTEVNVDELLAPANLAISVDNYNVSINWTNPNDSRALLGYNVYRDDVLLTEEMITETSYLDPDMLAGTYHYAVTAVYPNGTSPASEMDFEVVNIDNIQSPRNLTYSVDDYTVTVNWEAPANNERALLGYNVYIDGVLQNEELIQTLTFSKPNVEVGVYNYAITAFYNGGESDPAEIQVTVLLADIILPVRNLTASVQQYNVTLNWLAPDLPTRALLGYKVIRDGQQVNESLVSTLSFTDENVTPGNHDYQVIATYHGGDSEPVATSIFVENYVAPTQFTAVVSNYTVNMTWVAPATETRALIGYHIYRDEVRLSNSPITVLNYSDANVVPGAHTYSLQAVYTTGVSEMVNQSIFVDLIVAPRNVTSTVSNYNVTLNWERPATNTDRAIIGYNIYRNSIKLNQTPITELTYTQNNVVADRYTYGVSAVYSNGESAHTTHIVTVVNIVAPRDLAVRVNEYNTTLTWNPQSSSTNPQFFYGYNVYRDHILMTATPITALQYQDLDLQAGIYNYEVSSVFFSGESEKVSINAEVINLVAPTEASIFVTDYTRNVNISWLAPVNESGIHALVGYNIYRDGLLIAQNPTAALSFVDYDVAVGAHVYSIKAQYTTGMSAALETNITVNAIIVNNFPFVQGFEGPVFPPVDWTVTQTGTITSSWRVTEEQNYTYEGNRSAMAGFTAGQYWLVTPPITINAQSTTLSLMARDHSSTPNWDNTNEYFDVRVSTSNQGMNSYTTIGRVDNRSLTTSYQKFVWDLSAYNGQNIYIAFVRVANGGNYVYLDNITLDNQALPVFNAPTNMTAVAGEAQIQVSWTAPVLSAPEQIVLGYELYRNNSLVSNNLFTSTSYTDVNVTAGSNYAYYAKAIYTQGISAASNTAQATPYILASPRNLTAAAGNRIVNLAWQAPTSTNNLLGYKLYKNDVLVNTELLNVLTYADTNVSNNMLYRYKVTAVYTQGESAPSNIAAVIAYELFAPTNLVAVAGENNVQLNWQSGMLTRDENTETDEDRVIFSTYSIYRNGTLLTQTINNQYIDTNVTAGTAYNYYIIAVYSAGESLPSNTASATPYELVVPENLSATVEENTVTLQWGEIVNPPQENFYEGFENSFFPAGWRNVDANTDNNNWFLYSVANAAHTGNQCIASASWTEEMGAITPNNWLITPAISLNENSTLSWWAAAQDPLYPAEHYEVKVSTTSTMLQSFTTTLYSETLTSADWVNHSVDLSAFNGQNVYIAFVHNNCSNNFYLKLDDIQVTNINNQIVFTSNFDNKEDIERFQFVTETKNDFIARDVRAKEYSTTNTRENLAVTAYNVYRNNNLIGTVAPTQNSYVDANVNAGTYTYSVKTVYGDLMSDPASVSVTIAPTIISSFPYDESFEGEVFPPLGWTNPYEGSSSGNWRRTSSAAYVYEGTKAAQVGYSAGNYWLITPQVTINALSKTLSFYVRDYSASTSWDYTDEYLKVKVSVAGQDTSSFVDLESYDYQDLTTTYRKYTVDMSAYIGLPVYVAFERIATDGNYAYLDKVRFDNEQVVLFVAPTNLSANAGNQIVSLMWNAPTASNANLIGYKVYRNGIALSQLINDLTYVDNTVVNGTTYNYYVKAVYTNPNGESEASNTVSATPQAPVLYPPTNLTSMVEGSDVTLEWEAVPSESSWITHSGAFASSVGTNAAANFSVAQRFTAGQLTALGVNGAQLQKIRFVGHVAGATYTVKVWTGGSSAPLAPGTEIVSQIVPSITVDTWTEVVLTNPVTIPADAELWFGYNVNTPSGYPAGTDAGPALEGFGNVMYFNNAWTTLTALSSSLNRNWVIEAFAVNNAGQVAKLVPVTPVRETIEYPSIPLKSDMFQAIETTMIETMDRSLLGYKVYRGNALLTETPLASNVLSYTDTDVADGQYTYKVTALYSEGESVPATVNTTVNNSYTIASFPWSEGFEGSFLPMGWKNSDADGDGYKWFEYSAANSAHTGSKSAASASWLSSVGALSPDNWLITPRILLPNNGSNQTTQLSYWIAAQDASWPQEHYSVLVSTTNNNITSFTPLMSETLQSNTWSERTMNLNAYAGQSIYLAFRHHDVYDMFYLKLDDVMINVALNNEPPVAHKTALGKNFPNPFNPTTKIEYSVKEQTNVCIEVFNVKGQKVRTLINSVVNTGNHSVVWNGKDDNNNDAGSGVYFYRMSTANYSSTGKMILMK